MLRFEMNLSAKEKVSLLHALKKDTFSCPMLRQNIEDNRIAAIYDKDVLCGGALILGNEEATYLYCFFACPDYCTEQYHPKLKKSIAAVFPEMNLFDVHCLKHKDAF